MYFLLTYQVVQGFTERRMAHRSRHLKLAQEAFERGELLLAGAVGDPVDGAALAFRADDATVAESFARADPYVTEGLVTSWQVRPWNVVVGGS
jgi:uncharacterized protein YciI